MYTKRKQEMLPLVPTTDQMFQNEQGNQFLTATLNKIFKYTLHMLTPGYLAFHQ